MKGRSKMKDKMTQVERLDYLIAQLKAESHDYDTLESPDTIEEKRHILRSMMNVRPPQALSEEALKIQDEYLKERHREKGIVHLAEIPITCENLSIWQGDITRLAVDAIVNAANAQMLGCFVPMHLCIDNSIHTFSGTQLRLDCHKRMEALRAQYGQDYEQPTAMPMLTDGYNLPAKKIIHIVGPIVHSTLTPRLEEVLSSCYQNTLDLCMENGLKSVAFCCISTGVFHFPNQRAAQIATATVSAWLKQHPNVMERIIFNVFKDEDRRIYEKILH